MSDTPRTDAEACEAWGLANDTHAVSADFARKLERELASVQLDALCFRFWVSEAARSPSAMAQLIANCVTEDDYRNAILPLIWSAQNTMLRASEVAQ